MVVTHRVRSSPHRPTAQAQKAECAWRGPTVQGWRWSWVQSPARLVKRRSLSPCRVSACQSGNCTSSLTPQKAASCGPIAQWHSPYVVCRRCQIGFWASPVKGSQVVSSTMKGCSENCCPREEAALPRWTGSWSESQVWPASFLLSHQSTYNYHEQVGDWMQGEKTSVRHAPSAGLDIPNAQLA